MPRIARHHVPGTVAHVITRFVNGTYVMDEVPRARQEYLHRLDVAMCRSDWRLLWYCLMSNHVHLGVLSGDDSLERWVRPLNSGFAAWVNRRGRAVSLARRGPVIADRPASIVVPESRAGYLAAYIHNNPVRAGLVEHALDSEWSSHRMLTLGYLLPLPCMDMHRALALCGFDGTHAGRLAFGGWVDACRAEPRNEEISGRTFPAARAAVRVQRGTPTEVSTPTLSAAGRADYPPRMGSGDTRVASTSPIDALLSQITQTQGIDMATLRGRGRNATLVKARRIAVLACRAGHRPLTEVCVALGISDSAASYLIRTAADSDCELARTIAGRWVMSS